jgi:hypothetical protein
VPPQGASTPSSPASRLTHAPEGLIYTGDNLTYRVTGLTAYNLERLRVTVRAAKPDEPLNFHIDTIDLYSGRSRESFAESCTRVLKVQQGAVMAELTQLITALEAERIAMREKGSAANVPPMSKEDEKTALETLRSKDLLKRIIDDFDAIGYIGEKINKLIIYIAAISRLQCDPFSVLILSRSGAGKTSLQDAVCKFVPPEAVIQYTRLTGQSLFYRDKDALRNKVLAIEEEDGMREAMYSIKTLISSQKLSVAATRTDAKTGKFSVDEYTVYGPVVVFVSTTNPDALDDETKQRFLLLTIDETPEQTQKILLAQRTKNSHRWYEMSSDENSVFKLHHNMQRLLKPLTVTFPDDLKVHWPYGRLQMRREQGKFISLVKAIVLLHQYQRKTGTLRRLDGTKIEYVQATQKDVDIALELGKDIFARNIDDVSPTGRALLKAIVELVKEKYEVVKQNDPHTERQMSEVPFTRKELRERIGWSETQVRRNIDHLVELGYTGRITGRQGSTFRYVLLDTGEDDPLIEFRLNELEKNESGMRTGKKAKTENQGLSYETSPLRHNFVSTSPT